MKHKQQVQLVDGIVSEVVDATARVRVEIPDQGIVTKPLPVLVPYAKSRFAYALPAIDTHCKVLLDADGDEGVVLGYMYDAVTPPPVSDRAIVHHSFPGAHLFEFDESTGVLRINCTKIEITVPDGMHITNTNQETTINTIPVVVVGAPDSDDETSGTDFITDSNQGV